MNSTQNDRWPIQLTQGQVAWISSHRYADIMQYKWFAVWNSRLKCFVAGRNVRIAKGSGGQRLMLMHRYILGLPLGDPRSGDHINQNGLDNTDENLRIANHAQQQHNRRCFHHSQTGLKGVLVKGRRFQAAIRANGVKHHLGSFDTAELAHAAYAQAAQRLHGEFARLA